MNFITIKNSGKVGMEFCFPDDKGMRVSKDLLEKLINNIVKKATNYYDETEDHVFIYREKQLHTVVCPSIEDITSSFLAEHPLIRKPAGEEEYLGHVDYWISYRNYEFLLELKHTYFAYNHMNTPRQSIKRKFDRALEQLESVRKRECDSLTINKGLVKIALEAIVFYERTRKGFSDDCVKDHDFPLLFERMISNAGLDNKINFYSLWVLHERLVEPFEYFNCDELYPALGFIGQVQSVSL